jgi:hypothetical protein
MKRLMSVLLTGTLLLALMTAPVAGQDQTTPTSPLSRQGGSAPSASSDPPGELMIADALIGRPLGLAACVVGLAASFIVFPFTATSNSPDPASRQLLIKPFQWTFQRPLGQLNDTDMKDSGM